MQYVPHKEGSMRGWSEKASPLSIVLKARRGFKLHKYKKILKDKKAVFIFK